MNGAADAPGRPLAALLAAVTRRLNRYLLLLWLSRGLFAALVLIAAAAAWSRFVPLPLSRPALAAGVLAALAGAAGLWLGRRSRLDEAQAAAFADRRLGQPGRFSAARELERAAAPLAVELRSAADRECRALSPERLCRLRLPLATILAGLLAAFAGLALLFPPYHAGQSALDARTRAAAARLLDAGQGLAGDGGPAADRLLEEFEALHQRLEAGELTHEDLAVLENLRATIQRLVESGVLAEVPAQKADLAALDLQDRLRQLLGYRPQPAATPGTDTEGGGGNGGEPVATAPAVTPGADDHRPPATPAAPVPLLPVDYQGLIARHVPPEYRATVTRYFELFREEAERNRLERSDRHDPPSF